MYLNVSWLGYIDPISGEEVPAGDLDLATVKPPSFAPQVDLTGNSLPINEYTADVITTEDIPWLGADCRLYDDRNLLWCAWPVRKAVRISEKCVRITASSWIYYLDERQLAETVYVNTSASTAIGACFGDRTGDYQIGNAIAAKTVSGYVPAQSARERLTWLCFVLGAYVQDVYRSNAAIISVDSTSTLIPLDRTFMRPSMDRAKPVTKIKITTYDFHQATQAEWEEDDSSYMFPLPWVATTLEIELTNPLAGADDVENVVTFDSLYLINSGNVSEIATRLATYWFNNTEVQLDCINNRQYRPGDLVAAYLDVDRLIIGYIQQATFAFGKQARSRLKLIGAEARDGAQLTINFTHDNERIDQATYYLPVGVAFSITNPYPDKIVNGHRIIYRPTTATTTGTMTAGGMTVEVPCEIALDLYQGVLYVISVDGVEEQSSGGETIGVIE